MIHSYLPLLNPLPFFMGNGTVAMGFATGIAVLAPLAEGGNLIDIEASNIVDVVTGGNQLSVEQRANEITPPTGGNTIEIEEC